MGESERERLERLRAKQLKDREPGPTVKVEWKGKSAQKQEPFLKEFFSVLPPRAKGAIYGFAIGAVLSFASSLLMPSDWAVICGTVALLVTTVMGVLIAGGTDLGGFAD